MCGYCGHSSGTNHWSHHRKCRPHLESKRLKYMESPIDPKKGWQLKALMDLEKYVATHATPIVNAEPVTDDLYRQGGKRLAKRLRKLQEKYQILEAKNNALQEEINHLKVQQIGSIGGCMGECIERMRKEDAQMSAKWEKSTEWAVEKEPLCPSVKDGHMNLPHHDIKLHCNKRTTDMWAASMVKQVPNEPVEVLEEPVDELELRDSTDSLSGFSEAGFHLPQAVSETD